MIDVLKGEFFWGVIVGLLLSFFGAWLLAIISVRMIEKMQKKRLISFCIDTVKNINGIVTQIDESRDRSKAIYHDFLALIEVEVQIYGRNREHLILLPEMERNEMRKFMNIIGIKKA